MKWQVFPKSPVVPADKQWTPVVPKNEYSSPVTQLIRGVLQDEAIRKDQAVAWARWRDNSQNK